jgi:hypothetical protein
MDDNLEEVQILNEIIEDNLQIANEESEKLRSEIAIISENLMKADETIKNLIITNAELTEENEELERRMKPLEAEIRRQAQMQLEKAKIKYTSLLKR